MHPNLLSFLEFASCIIISWNLSCIRRSYLGLDCKRKKIVVEPIICDDRHLYISRSSFSWDKVRLLQQCSGWCSNNWVRHFSTPNSHSWANFAIYSALFVVILWVKLFHSNIIWVLIISKFLNVNTVFLRNRWVSDRAVEQTTRLLFMLLSTL